MQESTRLGWGRVLGSPKLSLLCRVPSFAQGICECSCREQHGGLQRVPGQLR